MYIKEILIDWERIEPDSYLRRIPSLRHLDRLPLTRDVTFFVGENGSGKSTLLEAIAIAAGFNPEGGSRNYSFSTFDSHSELCRAIRLVYGVKRARWGYFLRAESFYNVATKEDEYSRLPHGRPQFLHEKSHGESFMTIVQNNFNGSGLYLLDEPESALSPQRLLTLLIEIDRCRREGAQFIIVTHSPILLGLPDAQILSFDGALHPCAYEETESFKITSMFLNHREQILKQLLS